MVTDDIVVSDQLRNADLVRQKRGMAPINPTKIEGFGEKDEPAPTFENPYPKVPISVDDAARHEPVSPLIPPKLQTAVAARSDLWVEFMGQHVPLNPEAEKAIIRLVLNQRLQDIKGALRALADLTPRVPEAGQPKRGRGRPKGSKNKPKNVGTDQASE